MEARFGVHAGARLDQLPPSRFHWKLLSMIGAGLFLDAFDIFLAGSVLGALVKIGWSTMNQNADFIFSTFFGMVIGAWCAGILGDRYGRRVTYQANLLILGIASLLGALSPSMKVLIIARFFMGIGMGAEVVVGYAMLNEFVPKDQRGRWGAFLVTITNSSMLASAVLGYFIIPTIGWRWMFGLVGVGALVITILRKNMPESPRWLESKGRFEESEIILDKIEHEVGYRPVIVQEAPRIETIPQTRSFLSLFSRELICRTFVGAVCVVAMNIVLYGFVNWVPSFLVQRGVSITSTMGFTVMMAIGGPLGAFLPAFLADRFGRKPTIIVFCFIGMAAGAVYPYAQTNFLISASGFGVVLSMSALSAVMFGMYLPELFPTDLRMRGAGLCLTAARLATAVTPYGVLMVYREHGLSGVSVSMLFLLAIIVVTVFVLGIETKERSLEELASKAERHVPSNISFKTDKE